MSEDSRTDAEVKTTILKYIKEAKDPLQFDWYVKILKVKLQNRDATKAIIKFRFMDPKLDEDLGTLLSLDGQELVGTAPPGYYEHQIKDQLGDQLGRFFRQ